MEHAIMLIVWSVGAFGYLLVGLLITSWAGDRWEAAFDEVVGQAPISALLGWALWPLTLFFVWLSAALDRKHHIDEHADVEP